VAKGEFYDEGKLESELDRIFNICTAVAFA